MKSIIYKYKFGRSNFVYPYYVFDMPVGAEVLSVGVTDEGCDSSFCIWASLNLDVIATEKRVFDLVTTGEAFQAGNKYIGTATTKNNFVGHIFEVVK